VGLEESIQLEAMLLPEIVSLVQRDFVRRPTWDIALPTYLEVAPLFRIG
jgi:hypothetical protein